jgi:hypothetical protein
VGHPFPSATARSRTTYCCIVSRFSHWTRISANKGVHMISPCHPQVYLYSRDMDDIFPQIRHKLPGLHLKSDRSVRQDRALPRDGNLKLLTLPTPLLARLSPPARVHPLLANPHVLVRTCRGLMSPRIRIFSSSACRPTSYSPLNSCARLWTS